MKEETIVAIVTLICSVIAGLTTVYIMLLLHQSESASQGTVSVVMILFFISTYFVCGAFLSLIKVCMYKQDLNQFAESLLDAVKYSVITLIILWVLMHTQVVSSAQGIVIVFSSSQKAGAPGSLMTWSGIKMSLWGMGVMWLFLLVGVVLYALLSEEPESTEPKNISYEDCKH